MYTGQPTKFAYYSARIFKDELKNIRPSLTIANACERDFMEALRKTSLRMQQHVAVRALPSSIRHQGPQSIAHGNTDRRMFEPEARAHTRPPHLPQTPFRSCAVRTVGSAAGSILRR